MAYRNYYRTLFHEDLTEAEITLYISNINKYDRGSRIYMADKEPEDEEKIILTGLKSWTIVEGGPEADAIESLAGIPADENHEYLILNFANGKTEIYRNSYITMFIW